MGLEGPTPSRRARSVPTPPSLPPCYTSFPRPTSVFGNVAHTPAPVMSTARPAFPPLSLTRSTDRWGARVIFLIGCTQGRGVGCYLVFALARMSNTGYFQESGFLPVSRVHVLSAM